MGAERDLSLELGLRMYSSAVLPLNATNVLSFSTSEEVDLDEQQEEAFMAQPIFTHYHYQLPNRSAKSILSSFAPSMFAFPSPITLCPSGSELASPRLHHQHPNSLGSLHPGSLDFLSLLPPEISVKVLLYLHPQDLCR